jgi:rubrerythrin
MDRRERMPRLSNGLPPLEVLDKDGAIQETLEKAGGDTRRRFIGKAAAGGVATGVLFGGLGAFAVAQSGGGGGLSDITILNFALALEFLERDFYAEALDEAGLEGEMQTYAQTLREHEATHVDTLSSTIEKLGGTPISKPEFDFKDTTSSADSFLETAVQLEETGVSAYQGAAPSITSKEILAAAASILPVEAFHTAWGRTMQDGEGLPAPAAFNEPMTPQQVIAAVNELGFVEGGLSLDALAGPANAQGGAPGTAG